MAAIAPPPISRFAPPRTFEHTPPPADHTQTSGQMYHSHQYQHHQQQQQQPYPAQSLQYPPTAHTHTHPLAPPLLPTEFSPVPHYPNTQHDKAEREREHDKRGTMSRFKRSLQLRTRQPLSRTWEKASFAEECQSAPASMVDVNTGGVAAGYVGGAGRGDDSGDGAGSLYLPGHGQVEGGLRSVEMRRSEEGRGMHAGLFSPTGRPTSLYASPAAIRAFKPLPLVASPTDGSATPRPAPTPLRA